MFDERRARRLTFWSHLAFFGFWLPLSAVFVLVGPAFVVIGFLGPRDDITALTGLSVGSAVLWLGLYLLLVSASVWWYRRRIGPAFGSDEPGARREARMLAEVRLRWVHLGEVQLTGVEVGSCEPTRIVRFVNGRGATVLHFTAAGLLGLAIITA